MTDLEVINGFLQRLDLSSVELKLKERAFKLQDAFTASATAFQEAQKDLRLKDQAYIEAKAQLEGVLGFVLELAKTDKE